MKKMILLLLALAMILPGGALAEKSFSLTELKEKYEGQRWQGEYETARNETVSVNVGIYFPDAGEIGVLEAVCQDAPSGVHTDFVEPGRGYEVMGDEYFYMKEGWFSIGWPNYVLFQELQKEAKKQGVKVVDADAINTRMPYGTFDLNTAYTTNNLHTAWDCWNLVQTYTERFWPDENIQLMPHWLTSQTEPGKYKRDKKAEGGYRKVRDVPDEQYQGVVKAFFDQVIDGVPLVAPTPYGESGGCYSAGMNFFSPYGLWDEYYMNFVLIKPTTTIQEDVPLCDLELVLQTAEALIKSGRLRKVYSLRLGYDPQVISEGHFRLIPVWVVEGVLFENAKKEYREAPTLLSSNTLEDTILIFDAQSGELVAFQEGFPIW